MLTEREYLWSEYKVSWRNEHFKGIESLLSVISLQI